MKSLLIVQNANGTLFKMNADDFRVDGPGYKTITTVSKVLEKKVLMQNGHCAKKVQGANGGSFFIYRDWSAQQS